MIFDRELVVATEAVRKASLFARSIQVNALREVEKTTITKEDGSPVTIADYGAQAIIINAIKANFPKDQIVAEEASTGLSKEFLGRILETLSSAHALYDKFAATKISFANEEFPLNIISDLTKVLDYGAYNGGSEGRFWCLDPIDGTKGFIRGAQFAVCLALIVNGTVELGVIGCPNLLFSAFGGNDTTLAPENGYIFRAATGAGTSYTPTTLNEWHKITPPPAKNFSQMVSLEGVELSHSSHDEQSEIKEALGITRTLNLDSQVKYCILAAGLGDIYLRLPINTSYKEKIWDHAAGNIIIREISGFHTDAVENVPLDFSRGRTLLSKGIIASMAPFDSHSLIVACSSKVISSR